MQKTVYKVADFINWQKNGILTLSPKFQRRAVWKVGAKSFLIDTILRDYPVPIIFLRDLGTNPITFEPQREVVDGQQRLRTILSFVAPALLADFNPVRDSFVISKAHNKDAAGQKFSELDPSFQQCILNYEFSVQILPSTMDDREVVQLFRRLNSTNYTLNKQELRNATYFGEFKTSALTLSAEQLHRWRQWGTFKEDDLSRMQEVELTSECLLSVLDNKIGGRLSTRLDSAYKQFDSTFLYREEIERRFRDCLELIATRFAPSHPTSPLLRKRLIYTQIMVIMDVLFGLNTSLSLHPKKQVVKEEAISRWNSASEAIAKRTAPVGVLEATDRRTNDLKERKALFKFLKACF